MVAPVRVPYRRKEIRIEHGIAEREWRRQPDIDPDAWAVETAIWNEPMRRSPHLKLSSGVVRRRNRAIGGPKFLLVALISVAYYFISLYLLDRYYGGDRVHYNGVYDALSFAALSDIMDVQRRFTGSGEPLYGLTIWGASRLLSNDVFISLVNSALCGMIITLFLKYRAPGWAIMLIVTNFYLFVIALSAERLKFAILMLLAGILVSRRVSRIALLTAAPLFHIQTLLLYAALILGMLFEKYQHEIYALRKRKHYIIFGSIAGLLPIVAWKRDYIVMKVSGYSGFDGGLFQIATLTLVAALTFGRTVSPTVALASLWIPVFVLSGDRVNMIGYLVYLYYCLTKSKINNVYFLAISIYLSYKSIGFINSVIDYGDGFARAALVP